ncbi:MAG: SDR family NAD(P)-dependent oxidoreductase [Bacteroidales bacterium]|jgi:short-subunit dehydrogenase|nr:SDR family NAD(P)-dependent oxidoreductase [Bacteroidales bacterium]
MKVKDKVIVVTGGGNGIGRELVLSLLRRGSQVAALDINGQALEQTKALADEAVRERLSLHTINIGDKEAVDLLPAQIIKRHGAVDAIINNAGIVQPFVKVNDLDLQVIERLCHVNFFGALYMIKAFLPHLLKRPSAHIVNVASMGGFIPIPGQSIYGATKAALKLLTEGLISELAGTPVDVSIVFPGAINTNILVNSGLELPRSTREKELRFRPMAAGKAANIIIDGMEKGKQRIFAGKDSMMLNLFYRISPGLASKLVARAMKSLLS